MTRTIKRRDKARERKRPPEDTGYHACACRDCFDIAIGSAMCWACEESGCEVDSECKRVDAYTEGMGD